MPVVFRKIFQVMSVTDLSGFVEHVSLSVDDTTNYRSL